MIVAERTEAETHEFEGLLERSTRMLKSRFRDTATPATPDAFETEVCNHMRTAATDTPFADAIKQTTAMAFPDIVARRLFGVEVKMTKKDDWRSTGNSVREFSRVDGIERIYMLFGKFGGTFDVRTRPYQDCLSEVAVTHSPRYLIDMTLRRGQTIFDKIGIAYDELRTDPQIIARIKAHYRAQLKEGQELWWLQEDAAVSPVIRPFSSLSPEDKHRLKVEAYVLFPEILGRSTTKFERVAAAWIADHGIVSASLRDVFTAGGRVDVAALGSLPQIIAQFHDLAPDILRALATIEADRLAHYWRTTAIAEDRLDQWLALVEQHDNDTHDMPAVTVFEHGMRRDE